MNTIYFGVKGADIKRAFFVLASYAMRFFFVPENITQFKGHFQQRLNEIKGILTT